MSNKIHCSCDIPFSDCPHAMETPHGDKWYCTLPKQLKSMKEELLKAEKLKGSKLSANEKFLVEKFWNDGQYELRYYPSNKSVGYHKKEA